MKAIDNLLLWVQTTHHPIYEKYLIDLYEEEHGSHFNEEYARKAVCKMHHHDGSAIIHGEHWSIDEIENIISTYTIGGGDTKWDAYVAVHAYWHEMIIQYQKRGNERDLISDAICFFFNDEHFPDGKIWRYTHMNERNIRFG